MKYATVVVLALALALVAARPSEVPLGAKLSLDEPYELMHGDMAALMLSEVIKSGRFSDGMPVVTYDRDRALITLQVYGNPSGALSRTDRAREVLGEYWEWVQAWFIGYAERRLDIRVDEQDFRLQYMDRTAGNEMLLSFIGGQFVIP